MTAFHVLEVPALAVALAIDAAVVTAGLATSRQPARTMASALLLFSVFQAGMALIGAVGGAWLASWASAWDHWIAFGLLAWIGGSMLLKGDEPDDDDAGAVRLLALSVATSIDALAAGVGLPLMGSPVPLSVLTIGLATALLCAVAWRLGASVGGRAGRWGERL
ncbi:MAG: manganese efflux pump, partial [Alphaproteobacteria bacterium]|nr:manganese efflux pump [Alphaproteobacteria bacterium]